MHKYLFIFIPFGMKYYRLGACPALYLSVMILSAKGSLREIKYMPRAGGVTQVVEHSEPSKCEALSSNPSTTTTQKKKKKKKISRKAHVHPEVLIQFFP
jgi:hypothetical protein